jgi:hypothetical protein
MQETEIGRLLAPCQPRKKNSWDMILMEKKKAGHGGLDLSFQLLQEA